MSDAPPSPKPGTWSDVMGLRFEVATPAEVVATITVAAKHLQAFGLVHGGVYSGLVETATSLGAHLAAQRDGRTVVGIENHTSFLRAVRDGELRTTARPLHVGRTTQVWEADVCSTDGRRVAVGRVRFISPEAPAAKGVG